MADQSHEEVFHIEEEHAEKMVGETNLMNLRDIHFTAGVREGINAGKESALQNGFNCGYQKAFIKSRCIGKLRGVLRGILAQGIKDGNSSQENEEKIEALLLELAQVEGNQIEEVNAYSKDGKTLMETDGNLSKPQLTELWKKCRDICNERGIDLKTNETAME